MSDMPNFRKKPKMNFKVLGRVMKLLFREIGRAHV